MIIGIFIWKKKHDLVVTHPLISPLISFLWFFTLLSKRLMITKNLVMEIKNLALHHESWPVKLNFEVTRWLVLFLKSVFPTWGRGQSILETGLVLVPKKYAPKIWWLRKYISLLFCLDYISVHPMYFKIF